MIIRLTVVYTRYNVTMEIQCHKDTECVVSDETIEIKVASDKVRNKIKDFCKFARITFPSRSASYTARVLKKNT